MKPFLASAAAVAALAFVAHASAKPKTARCTITSAGDAAGYKGPCKFLPEKGGSFGLEPIGRKLFFDEVSSLSVWITEPGLAEVRGLTTAGSNSRWGEARRSRRDPACWEGADFGICVY